LRSRASSKSLEAPNIGVKASTSLAQVHDVPHVDKATRKVMEEYNKIIGSNSNSFQLFWRHQPHQIAYFTIPKGRGRPSANSNRVKPLHYLEERKVMKNSTLILPVF
jgi:hypothetical protein